MSEDEANRAVDFAVSFLEGFEGDELQEGVTEALAALREARERGYRMRLTGE